MNRALLLAGLLTAGIDLQTADGLLRRVTAEIVVVCAELLSDVETGSAELASHDGTLQARPSFRPLTTR